MRPLPSLVMAMLLLPVAAATHPVDLDPASLAKAGGEIIVFVDVSGGHKGTAALHEEFSDSIIEYSSNWKGSYAWSATAFLDPLASPDPAGWTHMGRAWANSTISWDDRGSGVNTHSVGEEYEWRTTGEHTCVGAGVSRMYAKVLARLTDAGTMLVRFEGMQWLSPQIPFDCRASDTGADGTTEHDRVGPSALVNAALFPDGVSRQDLPHLDLELAPGMGMQTFTGGYSGGGAAPGARDEAFAYCGERTESTQKSCSGSGTVEAILYVDPCNAIRKSYEKHLADVTALKAPPKGSSEQQVRAFSVDVRQKVVPLLADARRLELMCDGGTEQALSAVAAAQRAVADAWFDVARTHGLSQDGVRDALAAERAAQLTGAGEGNSPSDLGPSIERNGAPPPSGNTASVKVHSPVALHAWDADGRHVGWNAAKGAADLEVPNATFEGEAGGAQTLTLPEGVYRIAVDELGPGAYTVNMSEEGSGDLTPLRSVAGGASSFVLLVDHEGAMTLASARGTQELGYIAPSALRSTAPPPGGASSAGSSPSEGPAVDGSAARGAPGAGVGMVLALIVAVAFGLARPNKDRPRSR